MNFDTNALQNLADSQNAPVGELADVVSAAIRSAYRKTTGADPDADVRLDVLHSELTLVNVDGEDVTPSSFGRLAARATRQAVTQWTKDVQVRRAAGYLADMAGHTLRARVQRTPSSGQAVKFTLADDPEVLVVMPAGEAVPAETYTAGEQVTVLVMAVNLTPDGDVKLTVSRRQPKLLEALLTNTCPELRDGSVEVTRIARDPGVRAKIAVRAVDGRTDPVSMILGPAAAHIKSVAHHVGAEKLDIVHHWDTLGDFVVAALTPATGLTAECQPGKNEVEVTGTDDQLQKAAGRKYRNLQLAQRLTGAKISLVPRG